MMKGYIEKDKAIDRLSEIPAYFDNGDVRYGVEISIEEIKKLSTTDVKEVVYAKWIENEFESLIPYEENENGNPVMHKYTNYKCSICGRTEKEKEPYCNCGAKMDLEFIGDE